MSQQTIFSLDLLAKSGKPQAYKIHTLQLIFQTRCSNIYVVILLIMLQNAKIYSNIYLFQLNYGDFTMKNRKIKVICSAAALLCCTMLTLSGCGVFLLNNPSGNKDPEATDTQALEPKSDFDVVQNSYSKQITRFKMDLSKEKYGGASVKIASTKSNTIVPDETVSTTLSQELQRRNKYVEELLNVSISAVQADSQTMLDEMQAAVRAGAYYADLVEFPQSYISIYGNAGVLMNLQSLPGLQFDAEYFNPTGTSAGTGGDMIYALAGYASLNPDSLSAVFFNKGLMEQLQMESPYALVDRGEWTMDKYLEYTAALSALDGGYYSYAAQNTATYLPDLLFFSGGQRLTHSARGAYPYINFNAEDTLDLFAKMSAIVYDDNAYGNAISGISAFNEGNTLFLIDRLDVMPIIANSSAEWGILPLPKYSAEQEAYVSLAYYEDAMFFGAVPTISDVQKASDVLMALNMSSYGLTPDAQVKNSAYLYLRDNDSIRMLDIVLKSAAYDFAYTFANSNNAIPSATFSAVRNTTGGISSLQRYLDMWGARFENAMYQLFPVS